MGGHRAVPIEGAVAFRRTFFSSFDGIQKSTTRWVVVRCLEWLGAPSVTWYGPQMGGSVVAGEVSRKMSGRYRTTRSLMCWHDALGCHRVGVMPITPTHGCGSLPVLYVPVCVMCHVRSVMCDVSSIVCSCCGSLQVGTSRCVSCVM